MWRMLLGNIVILGLFTNNVAAQTGSLPLSLEDCVRLALSAQSTINLARQQIQIALYGLAQARSNFLPMTRINNTFTYNSPLLYNRSKVSFVALNGIREYNSVVNTALEVDTSGRLRAELTRAHADQDAALANAKITERDLRRVVTRSYYQLLLARHLVRAARDSLAEARSFESRTRLLVEKGEAAQGDLIKASSQVAFLEQALDNTELDAQFANTTLASLWTKDVNETLSVVDVLDQSATPPTEGKPEGGVHDPFMHRPEFELLDAQKRGFLADSRRARADLLPQGNIIFEYGVDSTRAVIRNRGYAALFNLNIPVFDWLKARSASRQFQLQAQGVESGRRIAERAFSKEYWDALERVKRSFAQISMTQAQVKLSGDNLRISRLRFEGGEGAALDVVTAQSQLSQARSNYFTTLSNYWNAKADLEIASGH